MRRIFDGLKTVTRRILTPQPTWTEPGTIWIFGDGHSGPGWYAHHGEYPEEGSLFYRCRYGAPGGKLWIKETWRPEPLTAEVGWRVSYPADGAILKASVDRIPPEWRCPKAAKKGNVSPFFMARWASRLTLDVTAVRVERLNGISREDAIAEGVERVGDAWRVYRQTMPTSVTTDPRASYRSLWESIHGAGSWHANPWVWVIAFRRVAPVETLLSEAQLPSAQRLADENAGPSESHVQQESAR